jgi:hypothetical protein
MNINVYNSDEKWLPIKGFGGNYEVSNLGRIRSYCWNREVIRKVHIGTTGYFEITLHDKMKQKRCKVHRLVALAFIPKVKGKTMVNHKNGLKTDNRVENLEWCTMSENSMHAYATCLSKPAWTGKFGQKNKTAKLVGQFTKDGKKIMEFYGAREAQRKTGVAFRNISQVCVGERPSAGGYIWKFI